jgi:predicted N-formylglutamate amidohydrolase
MPTLNEVDEAFETAGDPADAGPFLFTCDHASNRLPFGLVATPSDQELLDDHWGWDIGARDVTLALVDRFGGQAVLSRFSRLVADPNRSPDQDSFVVRQIDGQPISFNQAVDAAELSRRAELLFDRYHQAVDRELRARIALGPPVHLLSIHSFTPSYLGRARPMEIGVLFNDHDEDAWHLESALSDAGFESALNAPYSGKPPDRLIYAAERHGTEHGIKYLELEIRQDLIDTPATAQAVAGRIATALDVFRPAG